MIDSTVPGAAKKLSTVITIGLSVAIGAALLLSSTSALAFNAAGLPKEKKKLEPATRYSGRTPIDLSNGIAFNNGTYGLPNAAYESWAAAPVIVPGVSEKNYPYAEKEDFIRGLKESSMFVEAAIWNWQQSTRDSVKEYAKQAEETMKKPLEDFYKAVDAAKGAGQGDWEKEQANARQALINLRGTYSSLHKNVR